MEKIKWKLTSISYTYTIYLNWNIFSTCQPTQNIKSYPNFIFTTLVCLKDKGIHLAKIKCDKKFRNSSFSMKFL